MHTYIHACMHAYIHTYIHTYTHTHIHTYTHIHTHTYIHTHIIYIHVFIILLLDVVVQLLYPVHCTLLEGFGKCVEPSSKPDITKYFLEAENGLLNYGQYAARLPMAVERVSL